MPKYYQERKIGKSGTSRGVDGMSNNINEVSWKMEQLWQGCISASIAHAIMVAHYPELSNEHSWDGINYNIQDNEGARGTITFNSEYCVGAFRNDNSDRIKTINNAKQAKEYFVGAPKDVVNLAENEALQNLLENVEGKAVPIITTAFWGVGENIFTIDSEEAMHQNGVFLLERQLMDFDSSIESWAEYYDMSLKQCDLLKTIFNKKINPKVGDIILSKDDIQQIGTSDINGLEESRISFEEIGIMWE
ncbi:hypothetical protein [Clostridium frigidicarnis]|uniref:Uncharacterized protein n=1 Tax=Clostridium frigidicarnis TaxID=84698 RepID=A0A1I1ALD0_9CLOT|nr:hypothetical protein [Clostridium frigidicarnis]SFB38166.1 hypothetical protein SAMN04488528_103835 [Clostridium frigidicarnis]